MVTKVENSGKFDFDHVVLYQVTSLLGKCQWT